MGPSRDLDGNVVDGGALGSVAGDPGTGFCSDCLVDARRDPRDAVRMDFVARRAAPRRHRSAAIPDRPPLLERAGPERPFLDRATVRPVFPQDNVLVVGRPA